MTLKLIEHNILDDEYKLEYEKIKKTEKYIKSLNQFSFPGVILYLIILDRQLIGYVFIGQTTYNPITILLNLFVNFDSYSGSGNKNILKPNTLKLILKEIIRKCQKVNKLLGIKPYNISSIISSTADNLISTHLEYGFQFNHTINNNLHLYTLITKVPSTKASKILSSRTHKLHSSKSYTATKTQKSIQTSLQTPLIRGYDNTYIISTRKLDSLIFTYLQSKLEKHNLLESTNPAMKPLLLWREHLENYKYDPKYSITHSWITNILSNTKTFISNKANLYNNFYKHYPKECLKYMAQTWNFKQNPQQFLSRVVNSREVFIMRPAGTGAFSGKDIVVIHNKASFNEALQIAKQNDKAYEKIIISKYITDPLLFQGRKFHLRTYFIAGIVSGHYVAKFLDFYELYQALKPYHNADYNNHDIHDTHFGSTDRDYICPQDLPEDWQTRFNNKVYPNMRTCMLLVAKMFSSVAKPYPEAQNAFEIFGCDFLVRENNDVVLMEINDRIGFKKYTVEKRIEFSKLMLDVIYKGFLLHMLEPSYKLPNDFWLYKSSFRQQ